MICYIKYLFAYYMLIYIEALWGSLGAHHTYISDELRRATLSSLYNLINSVVYYIDKILITEEWVGFVELH